MKKKMLMAISFFVVGCVTQPQVPEVGNSTSTTKQDASRRSVQSGASGGQIATPSPVTSSLPSSEVFNKRISEMFFRNQSGTNNSTLQGSGCRNSVAGWRRIYGACDDAGRLKGFGGAIKDNLYIAGEFSNGLPNGPIAITFLDELSVSRMIERQGPIQFQKFSCVIEFVNGRLGNELRCDQSLELFQSAQPGIVRFTSSSGGFSFVSESNSKGGQIQSIVGRGMRLEAAWRDNVMGGDVANFKVDSIDMRLDDNLLPGGNTVARGLTLKTTGFRTTVTIAVSKSGATGREGFKNGAVIASVTGPFEFSSRHGLIFQAVSRDKFNSESGESVLFKHANHLYQMNLNGEQVSAVFLRYRNRSGGDYEIWKGDGRGNPAFEAEIIYFKDGKFEFDAGRYERCDAKTGGANITYKYFDVPEFLPACGYLRDFKSGKEYYGNFDGKGMPIGRY